MQLKAKFLEGNLLGILCAMGAGFFFSLNDVTIKFLSGDYALHQIILLRSAIGLALIMAMVQVGKGGQGGWRHFKTQRLGTHLLRGACVVFANMLFFLGLAAMPLADAVAIFFISPVVITLFSMVFLKEKVNKHRWVAIVLGFVGVLIIVQPGSSSFQMASLLPIGSAFGYALLHILTRTMRMTESASTMTFYIQLTFVIVCSIMWLVVGDGRFDDPSSPSLNFLLRAWTEFDIDDLKLFILLGVASTFGGYLISQAYRQAEAALAAPFEYIALPLAIFWGIMVFDEWPSQASLYGGALILTSGLYTMYRETIHGKKLSLAIPRRR